MKHFKIIAVLVVSLVLISCNNQEKKKEAPIDESIAKIEVIDFHSTHRCMTCNAIEANTKYTLETYFAEELGSGKITFQVINVDLEENARIAEKFEAAGTSLFLNIIKDGTENKIDMTDFAFMNGTDQDTFSNELKAKIDSELSCL